MMDLLTLSPGQFSCFILYISFTLAWLWKEISILLFSDQGSSPDSKTLTSLRAAVEFSLVMAFAFICDRTETFTHGEKTKDLDVFAGLLILVLVVAISSLREVQLGSPLPSSSSSPSTPPPVSKLLINRDQTNEWKGWMQVMFLLYHYFNAGEVYNFIRVFIASYVWMTGYGNYLYYTKTKNFSVVRLCQSLWRINFLALVCCACLNNEYMLYYICPLHTFFTLTVYAFCWLLVNKEISFNKLFGGLMLIVLVLWSQDWLFKGIFKPFGWLLDFHPPEAPGKEGDHEWYFRSGLDHMVWVIGILMAHVVGQCGEWLQQLETKGNSKTITITKLSIFFVCLSILYVWYSQLGALPKLSYNVYHPYTSFIPIACYLVLRNLSSSIRSKFSFVMAEFGKITLETYILQFHFWLACGCDNCSPKKLLVLLPGWPSVNFALTSILFLFLSKRTFETTNILKDAVIPTNPADTQALRKNLLFFSLSLAAFYALAWGILNTGVLQT